MKALGPAPERMMARVEGEVERWVKRGGSSCHILSSVRTVERQKSRKDEIRTYSSLKAFILSGRLISTWATNGRG